MVVVLRAMVERKTQPEYLLVENVAGFEVWLLLNLLPVSNRSSHPIPGP